ncbi:MAG: NADPH:quinone reductase [Candidatus Solibacter sp.]|jgi:NADPH2:quinone reductase|nr:NADPH:quinone reductase [Candidatus Solibacter sp.]
MTVLTKTRPARKTTAPSVPATMRAAAIERFGGPEMLQVVELPVPTLDPGEVLIAVHTAGVGSWDADMRAGWSPGGKPRFPMVLGTDGSGHIAAVGSRVRRFHSGDAVYAYSFDNPKGGFYAEYVAVAADKTAPVPEVLGMKEAGAIPTTGLTALQGIDQALHVKRAESVIILGASGGVGTLAVQFAKLRGARVLAIASGDDGVKLVRRLGADVAIDGHHEDILSTAREFAPDGIDAVLALAGGPALDQCMEALNRSGRLAYPNGVEPEPRKRRGLRVIPYDAVAGVTEFAQLNRAVTAAKLRVPIAAAYPLQDAAEAHRRLAERHVLGKIVLRVR